MDEYWPVLFWVFVCFFVLFGLASLTVPLGFWKNADPEFRKWAVRGFATSVVGAVVALFKVPGSEVPLYVTLVPPVSEPASGPEFASGTLEYDQGDRDGSVETRTRPVEIVLAPGGWQVKLPSEVIDKPVRLRLQDRQGHWWSAHPFYPNYTTVRIAPGEPPRTETSFRRPIERGVVLAAELERVPPAATHEQTSEQLQFDNYARKTSIFGGRQFYQWRVFVKAPPSLLDTIAEVQYVLHPTFPEPVQVATDATKQFELLASGWGGFEILITVSFKDGRRLKTSYYLDLTKDWPPPDTTHGSVGLFDARSFGFVTCFAAESANPACLDYLSELRVI